MLERSQHLRSGNFEAIGVTDLRLLFDALRRRVLRRAARRDAPGGLRRRDHVPPLRPDDPGGRQDDPRGTSGSATAGGSSTTPEYEIAISTLLLFQTFDDIDRPVTVTGLRLPRPPGGAPADLRARAAPPRRVPGRGEVELRQAQFQALSEAIFGHASVVHDLVTPREIAAKAHAIRQGDLVAFDHDGTTRVGRVNRITKRATVLVEDPAGRLFSDGRRYATFYVPVNQLRKEGM